MTENKPIAINKIELPDGQIVKLEGASGTSLPLFSPVLQDHILSFEESKGYALQGTWVHKESAPERYGYPEFYAKCIEEKNAGIETQTTLGEITITTYNNANGHIFYNLADKEAIDTFFDTYGVCWMYGIDEENERVFLPRNNWFMQVTTDTSKVGQYIEAGLPNIEGKIGAIGAVGFVASGAFYDAGNGGSLSNSGEADKNAGFDASRFNKIYGKSDTVQPASVVNALYIVVGNNEQKSAITDVIEITTSENDTLPLFTGMYFDFSPNNPSWLKAGEQVNSGGIYTSCYNTLVNCLEGINPYNIMVVDVTNLEADIDYSEYWKVNQDEMWFKTPAKLSFGMINPSINTVPVVGNGKTLGLIGDSGELGLTNVTTGGGYGVLEARFNPAPNAGVGSIGSVYNVNSSIGVSGDASKSGLIADLSNTKSGTAQLYFKVANAVQNLELLDAGKVLEALADKIGRQDCKSYVIKTYENGASGFRLYSDRYIKQWGQVVATSNGSAEVPLLVEMRDIDYFINSTGYLGSTIANNTAYNVGNAQSWARGTDRFYTYGLAKYPRPWIVEGYVSEEAWNELQNS